MAIYTLLLKDLRNKVFQKMIDINQSRNNHLTDNVNAMLLADMLIQIEQINFDDSIELEKRGWKDDSSLYDRLIMEYSSKTNKFLVRWVE